MYMSKRNIDPSLDVIFERNVEAQIKPIIVVLSDSVQIECGVTRIFPK